MYIGYETFTKFFFEKLWSFLAITKGVKQKLPFWQYFFLSACIFGRKIIWPKIVFVRSANTLESFQNNFQECGIIIEHNKRGPWGGGPLFPSTNSNPDFIRFCAKRFHVKWQEVSKRIISDIFNFFKENAFKFSKIPYFLHHHVDFFSKIQGLEDIFCKSNTYSQEKCSYIN